MKSKTITGAAATILLITMVSKLIGFFESAIVAAFFGTSSEIDMYYLANSIANRFVFTVFSGLSVVCLTMYTSLLQEKEKEGADRFVSALICFIVPIAIIVSILIFIFSPVISSIMTENYTVMYQQILTNYMRIFSITAVFYSLMTIFAAILNANKVFLPGVCISVIQNVTMIVCIILLSKKIGVTSVVIGFVFSYLLQTLFLYFFVRKYFLFEKFDFKRDISIKKILLLMFPLVLGEATNEINIIVDQYLATIQGAGTVSAISYSETLNDIVTAIFIQTVTTVLLSFFSELAVEKKYKEMMQQLKSVMKIMTVLLVPITIITITSSRDLVAFIFGRGDFDAGSVEMTALALTGYSFGFVFKMWMVIAKRPFFAIENTMIPMIVGIITVGINISISVILVNFAGILGITLGTSIAYLCASIIYFILLAIHFENFRLKEGFSFAVKMSIATIIIFNEINSLKHVISVTKFSYLVVVTVICFVSYYLLLRLLKLRELKQIQNYIADKFISILKHYI